MNLFIEHFKPKNLQRYSEYLTCLHENLANPLITKIFVFISDGSNLNFYNSKLKIISKDHRPTFRELFEFANSLKNSISIIACSDILFDDTLDSVKKEDLKNTFLALTRYDLVNENGKWVAQHFLNSCSQDVWIFKTPIKISESILDQMIFTAGGYWGCDNKIAYLMDQAGFTIKNPSLLIRTYHYHASDYRSVTVSDARLSGPFLGLVPNDSVNKPTEYIRIKEFNPLGEPILE